MTRWKTFTATGDPPSCYLQLDKQRWWLFNSTIRRILVTHNAWRRLFRSPKP